MVVDSHCHLEFEAFEADRADMLARARNAGVERMVTICTRVSRFAEIRAIATAGERIDCSVGVHPHHVEEEGVVEAALLVELAGQAEVVGIGETGLDFYYDRSPREAQRESFRNHIAAAREAGVPLIVHTRDADDETAEILNQEMKNGPFAGVLHCFSGGRALAEAAVGLGLYVSFSGILTFRNSEALREIARDLPLDRVLVETDAPYLAPVPRRGKRNEPAFVVHTLAALAAAKRLPEDEVAQATTANFYRLFAKSAVRAGRCA